MKNHSMREAWQSSLIFTSGTSREILGAKKQVKQQSLCFRFEMKFSSPEFLSNCKVIKLISGSVQALFYVNGDFLHNFYQYWSDFMNAYFSLISESWLQSKVIATFCKLIIPQSLSNLRILKTLERNNTLSAF